MMDPIRGFHGLWYVSDGAVFIAAQTEGGARELVAMAHAALKTDDDIPGHVRMRHDAYDDTIFVPEAEWQTSDQRKETLAFFKVHLAKVMGTAP